LAKFLLFGSKNTFESKGGCKIMPFEPETPFGKAIEMFLEDRLIAFKPEDMDIQYSERYGAAGRLEERLLSVLPETVKIVYDEKGEDGEQDEGSEDNLTMEVGIHEILNKLSEEKDWFIGAAAEMAYKKGFSEALKLLCHCLAMS
jgi:hypothetical protein